MKSRFRIGNGYDVHLLSPGLRLVLGGVDIPHTKGLVAHSDGDVAIHALCDALLGALSLGDIGHHFPDTSAEFKGIDSKILLERSYALILDKGYRLVNADITILLQKPKVAPYILKMRETLAQTLSKVNPDFPCAIDDISVKATTTEGAGFVGREEGVAVYATVLVEKICE
ncbi:MAG: 2-C-methyl-D-erythritol 2,4-cyclodiphosphate synthase [Bacteroidales bacterium]|nr:2-C-methyl-D-erythritol 2,4-cyclodiphosphate synthase [Bacteroidales bacterium]MBP5518312.1 2-C-methyl-D-erythritol 2,4-cyclodiphosphate synthase [Bacteroidales bacterium]